MNYSSTEARELCLSLLLCETEKEIIDTLRDVGMWHNSDLWRPFGDNENNWASIGNQQGNPVAAIVEKLVNSIDAVLMRECYLAGIHPESNRAPQSIAAAIEQFFRIRDGNLANITGSQRAKLAENIGFIATGRKKMPNYAIFDLGEGQTPLMMPETLLSLSKSNKLRIPFVQGKFNMGGTGVLPFCGSNNFQLIISRRHPEIVDRSDNTSAYWGFTIVRREEPSSGRRSSMFTYLAPEHEVLMFYADNLQLPDNGHGTQPMPILPWGTIIKLYEYEMPGLKSIIMLDLYNQISLTLSRPGLPIRFYERRGYTGHSLETTMAGLHVRLQDDKLSNLEEDFPSSHELSVRGEPMTATVYAFKKGNAEKYRKYEGIVFLVNGQMHGVVTNRFFSSTRVNMGYIADSILVLIDATNISPRSREDLFMNSRDRVRRGELYSAIESALEELIYSHQGLRDLRERRRREAMENRLSDSKPLKEVLDDILKKSPALTALFVRGVDIGNPTKSKLVADSESYDGKTHPTFFRIVNRDVEKQAHMDQRFRVQFETDATNDYLDRDNYPGQFSLYENGKKTEDYVLNLWNGTATLSVRLPDYASEGITLHYLAKVEDGVHVDPFVNEFARHVASPISPNSGAAGHRKLPSGSGDGDRQVPDRLSLPEVQEVREEKWREHNFDKYSALEVINSGNGTYDFYVNMDNAYLRAELKGLKTGAEPKLIESQFKFALVLVGLALLHETDQDNAHDEEVSPEDRVFQVSQLLAPILIPMITSLGELTLNDIMETTESTQVWQRSIDLVQIARPYVVFGSIILPKLPEKGSH